MYLTIKQGDYYAVRQSSHKSIRTPQTANAKKAGSTQTTKSGNGRTATNTQTFYAAQEVSTNTQTFFVTQEVVGTEKMKYWLVVAVILAGYFLPAFIQFPPLSLSKWYLVNLGISCVIAFSCLEIRTYWLTVSLACVELFCVFVAIYGLLENVNLVTFVYVLYYYENVMAAALVVQLILLIMGAPWQHATRPRRFFNHSKGFVTGWATNVPYNRSNSKDPQ